MLFTDRSGTNVDDAFIVADEQVAENAGFIEVTQTDHVFHPMDGSWVHGLNVCGILRANPVFLCEQGNTSEEIRRTVD